MIGCRRHWPLRSHSTWIIGLALTMGVGLTPVVHGLAEGRPAMALDGLPVGEGVDHVELDWPFANVYAEHLARLTRTDAIAGGVFVEIPGRLESALAGLRGHADRVALVTDDQTSRLLHLAVKRFRIGCGTATLCLPGSSPPGTVFLELQHLMLTRSWTGVDPDAATVAMAAEGLFHPGRLRPPHGAVRAGHDDPLPIAFKLQVQIEADRLAATLALEPSDRGFWAGPAAALLQQILGPDRAHEVRASGLLARGWQGGTLSITAGAGHNDSR